MNPASQPVGTIDIQRSLDGRWVVVSVSGVLDVATVPTLKAALIPELLRDGRNKVALDVSGLTFCDSTGMGVFVCAWQKLRDKGGQFVLLRPSERLAHRLRIAGLSKVIPTAQSLDTV